MSKRQLDLSIILLCVIWITVTLLQMISGPWRPSVDQAVTLVGAVIRLGLLAIAAWASIRSVVSMRRDNPAHKSQILLASGFCTFFAAQIIIFYLQLSTGGSLPYPSIADAIFVVGLVLLIAGVALAIRASLFSPGFVSSRGDVLARFFES